MIHVITGDGAGKTSSAIGKIIRALGHGSRVLIVQFYKNDENEGMYRQFVRNFKNGGDVEFVQYGTRCVNPEARERKECKHCGMCMQDKRLLRRRVLSAIRRVKEALNERDSIVLDEILVAYSLGHISREEIEELINMAPDKEWYLTGRLWGCPVCIFLESDRCKQCGKPETFYCPISDYPVPEWLYNIADYVVEVIQWKHPYNKGVKARIGVEY